MRCQLSGLSLVGKVMVYLYDIFVSWHIQSYPSYTRPIYQVSKLTRLENCIHDTNV